MKTIIALVLVIFTLFGCGRDENHNIYTSPMLSHTTWTIQPGAEQTPVVWQGRIVIVMFQRPVLGFPTIQFVDYETRDVLSVINTDMTIGAAIVSNDELFVFGVTGYNPLNPSFTPGNSIAVIRSSDLLSWSTQKVVFTTTPTSLILNISVAPDPNGFIMSYDYTDNPAGDSTTQARFIGSKDLIAWEKIDGVIVGYKNYLAAATVRYSGGYYYIAYTQSYKNKFGYYLPNVVSRSTDLVTWESAVWALVSPLNDPFYQYSSTDADLVEFNGKTVVIYSTGDQGAWDGQVLRSKTCDCTMDSLLSGLFL